ncbi:MAG: chromosome segregation protein SMC [Candidatus Acidiferrales bacterium]
MLKLRKVELLGFKSFCEKTQITFSGNGITCIVGPNGCGKSNIVDAISWVLGEQSHKLLRAERMSDCIFNGTAKRPPLGMSEVTLTLVDPELADAVAHVLAASDEAIEPQASDQASGSPEMSADAGIETAGADGADSAEPGAEDAAIITDSGIAAKFRKKRPVHKPAHAPKPGEVVIGRRLYRSGQSEYIINGRVARLRDVQELFMGMGLGPDSYAIIEQGRIGQILNSKPMDRRAIIEEAAGITMYKTKRRLAEAKLEASRVNLSRVNDILVEVEKQLASLKRQASKARRYAELREQMRGALRTVLASKAQHLDSEAERLERTLREMAAAEDDATRSLHELEAEQERLNARNYELEAELRQTQNLLSQTALDLDRAENRIAFNQEQARQLELRIARVVVEIEQAERESAELDSRRQTHETSLAELRASTAALEAALRQALDLAGRGVDDQKNLEARIDELRALAARMSEESIRSLADATQADETVARLAAVESQRAASLATYELECSAYAQNAQTTDARSLLAEIRAQELDNNVRDAQARLAGLRKTHAESKQSFESMREALSAARARRTSLEQILDERAYSADAVQKLFATSGGEGRNFRAVGLLADYAEVEEKHESAIEQFLRDELEYVVVETFDHAREGVALLRNEMGGRATFFVDSLRVQNIPVTTAPEILPATEGVVARLDRLVEFRDPLGPAAKQFLSKLQSAYVVESVQLAEELSRAYPELHFLTLDGTCFHGRTISGGRASEAGPLALKRELRLQETESVRLEAEASTTQTQIQGLENEITQAEEWLTFMNAENVEAAKEIVSTTHQRDQARMDLRRVEEQRDACLAEINAIRAEANTARERAKDSAARHSGAQESRATAEAEAAAATERLAEMRQNLQTQQETLTQQREELAAMSERLASAESISGRIAAETLQVRARIESLREQHGTLVTERAQIESSTAELAQQAENLRAEKFRIEEKQALLEREWDETRSRTTQLDATLRGQRQSLDEQRAQRSQCEIEKARNDSDRDYLRQACVAELNAQPEELIGQDPNLLTGEALIAAETNYNEMKARVEAMGPVNMMALEEYQECEQRDSFLRREHADLIEAIQNTQQTIAELEQISRQKFEEAFHAINTSFAAAFTTLFGGGHGEMRLTEPDSSGEAGIDVVAQPPGKRLQNVLLLSGGEKALTALALLIAVFRYQPSPFCILDEVDAPLDEANVGRFIKMLREMGTETQFIVVTHNRKTMETGSVLYGVTMQEPGVSKLVSVRWDEVAQQAPVARAATNAA